MQHAATIQPLSWDTDFLGFRVGRLHGSTLAQPQLEDLLAQARQAGYRLLYWFVAPTDAASARAAAAAGAILADRKIRLRLPVRPDQTTTLPPGIVSTTDFSPALQALAAQAGEYSRFQVDPHFGPDVYRRLYGEWLRRSLAGELAREVLVYQPQPSEPVQGFLTLAEKNNCTEMVLMAVDAAQRGRGIGAAFIEAARCRAAAWGHAAVQLTTQAANPACRLYQRQGFVLEHEEHVYHLWL
ncbi:GNAT family N-acetyltransferase [Hymenobacter weizhouensis]|uniref:GNAT family N-acetyltransferase n=1 Tax=Hymenobacter sp. YIM 151500-1 TaxID=2987689 RepID=UPI002226FEAB|nr:GNAT family N-acetyltransferase [Hymenobacter sp. YIM 151500-1]UYZ63055.1 GNAT family N-acetyltransferase [Hymenobacter sp. YIM 151500-1]